MRARPILSASLLLLALAASASAAELFRPAEPNRLALDPPVTARYVRIVLDGSLDGMAPCLDELELYAPGGESNLAVGPGAVASASSVITGYSAHAVEHLNDGLYGNACSWVAAGAAGEWAQIELPEPAEIGLVVLSRDRNGSFTDRVPARVQVLVSLDGAEWTSALEAAFRAPGSSGAPALPPPPPLPGRAPQAVLDAPRVNEHGHANLALDGEASASSVLADGANPLHRVAHLNDGRGGNDRSWIADASTGWAEIDLGAERWVYQVALGNDNSGAYTDRATGRARILAATTYADDSDDPAWATAATIESPLHERRVIGFQPVRARWVRVAIDEAVGEPRIDELEIYGGPDPISDAVAQAALMPPEPRALSEEELLRYAFVAEEHAWLKTFGYADLDPGLVPYNGRVTEYPRHVPDDFIPIPPLGDAPDIDGSIGPREWAQASTGAVRVAAADDFQDGALVEHRLRACVHGGDLCLALEANRLLQGRLILISTADWSANVCLELQDQQVVLRVHQPDVDLWTERPVEAAIALGEAGGAVMETRVPLDVLPDADALGLRIGLGFGGHHTSALGRAVNARLAPIGLAAQPDGQGGFEVRVSRVGGEAPQPRVDLAPGPLGVAGTASVDWQGTTYTIQLLAYDPAKRALDMAGELLRRLSARGVRLTDEARRLRDLETERAAGDADPRDLFFRARLLKREIFLRDPDLAPLQRILYVERHPFEPSHIYTDYTDAPFRPGGGVCVLEIPWENGLAVSQRSRTVLFDSAGGIARDPIPDFAQQRVYFGYRPAADGFYHLMAMNPDGRGLTQLTDGPFHDYYPCPLPDGDLAFISTRCTARVFCFRGASAVLFRMAPDGSDLRPLSFSSLSEWAPSVMNDGRIIWTRWEYIDKGADFTQTLWATNPDGTRPELVFGNTIIQPNGYASGREVPGTQEIACTLVSHFGDINGPIALLDLSKGRFNPAALTSITPEVPWPGMWPRTECFRDPYPISRDLFLVSHAAEDRFGLYVIDRYGNREILHLDPVYGSMGPIPLAPRPLPPIIPDAVAGQAEETGRFVLMDVYRGLGEDVERGSVKWLRVVEEVRHNLHMDPNRDHEDFVKWYASPVDIVSGPYGWPTYVAKAPLGLVPVDEDGSASFTAPAGKVLYFQALDENLNEIQRMRSMVHLQPGEARSCIGCHEDRVEAPPVALAEAMVRPPVEIQTPEWGGEPFSYERIVQPVWDANCVSCHNESHPKGLDLRGDLDAERVPASYRNLITRGLVHYVDCGWNSGGCEKLPPLSFGTVKSPLWSVLNAGHQEVALSRDEMARVKTWIDLNCPLWPDYTERQSRPLGPDQPSHATRPGATGPA